ncbi:uncharacterized protein At4g00950-like [Sesamum indicum]|uniref:Uncharacterized protein At4g00950-like n=1 Tax=Sesamum indicum TaxID=4182 RepID=A0A6I9U4G5_SESIN|nr:uncharacterized protein At4g00950-like [Sesamum indicum]
MVEATNLSFSTLKLQFLHTAALLTTDSPHRDRPSGISTPPLQTPASVPFKWEEEPGKPRLCTPIITNPPSKCLELPPACRMLLFMDNDAPPNKTPSPTTLLDGPYNVGRPKSSSFRFFREGQDSLSLDSRAAACGSNKGGGQKVRGRFFWKLRSGGKKVVDVGGISEFFSTTSGSSNRCGSSEERRGGVGRKMGRHESFSGVAHANNKSSHMIWATIYQGLKQVVQWKSSRNQINKQHH